MNETSASMSPLKTGLSLVWFTFWTGAPIKLGLCLVMMAMGVHPWEMPGVAFLLLLSIPIDMWATGVVSRTLFLEKFRRTPPDGLGMTLWWQVALVNVVLLPIIYYVQTTVTGVAKSVAQSIMETDLMKNVPVAERIGIELTTWGSVATIVLLVLVVIWLSIVGRLVLRQVSSAAPSNESYQKLITRWDLMRVPADQTLMLAAITGAGVLLTFVFWGTMPVTTPHPNKDWAKPEEKALPAIKPLESLNKDEKALAQLDAQIAALEARQAEIEANKKKAPAKTPAPKTAPAPAATKPGKP